MDFIPTAVKMDSITLYTVFINDETNEILAKIKLAE